MNNGFIMASIGCSGIAGGAYAACIGRRMRKNNDKNIIG